MAFPLKNLAIVLVSPFVFVIYSLGISEQSGHSSCVLVRLLDLTAHQLASIFSFHDSPQTRWRRATIADGFAAGHGRVGGGAVADPQEGLEPRDGRAPVVRCEGYPALLPWVRGNIA